MGSNMVAVTGKQASELMALNWRESAASLMTSQVFCYMQAASLTGPGKFRKPQRETRNIRERQWNSL
jgi:hypothetical protein